jgi:CTP synthase
MLYEHGIFPDFILCRAIEPLDDVRKNKIASYINLDREQIISAPDVVSLYQIPINFEKENLGKKILKKFNLEAKKVPDWTKWQELLKNIISPKGEVDIAIVGKYIDIGNYKLEDSYISIKESLMHAGAHLSTKVNIFWIDSKEFEQQPEKVSTLKDFDGIIIPGGFGSSGVEGKIMAIKFCRENKIPYLGLCYGLHLAVVEFARNICDLKNANTSEICNTDCAVIDILPWQKAILEKSKYGATMRLGSYAAKLDDDSLVYGLYKKFASNKKTISPVIGKTPPPHVFERHRHRYEVNPAFHEILQEKGLIFSGYHISDEGAKLIEFIELPREKHPFFIATQAHPEFKSSFESPAPLFAGFVLASINKKESTQDE